MRVILTVNFSPWAPYSGGGQRSTHNLASAHVRAGRDVHVVFTRPPWEDVALPPDLPYTPHFAALFARRSRSAAKLRPLTAVTVAGQVARLLEPGAVVHGNGEEAALIPALRSGTGRRFPFVMTPRYPAFPAIMEKAIWRRSPVRQAVWLTKPRYAALGPCVRGADRCCPTSRSSADTVSRIYDLDPARVEVVPNGVASLYLEHDWAPEPGPPVVVCFGRLAAEKAPMDLLEACARLGDQAPRVYYFGRGPEAENLERRASELGLQNKVELKGWAGPETLAAAIAGAAAVVLPSREESFGNAMAETMAVGAPLVSTTAGSIPEVVADGETGILVRPGDVDAMAAAIRRLLAEPETAARMGAAGKARVRERFTWDAVAARYAAIYEELLGP